MGLVLGHPFAGTMEKSTLTPTPQPGAVGRPPPAPASSFCRGNLAASGNKAISDPLACCLSNSPSMLPMRQVLHHTPQYSQRHQEMPVPPSLGHHDCNYPRKAWERSLVWCSADPAQPMQVTLYSRTRQQNANCFVGIPCPTLATSQSLPRDGPNNLNI